VTVFGAENEIPSLATPRLMRWVIFLAEFDHEIDYIKGLQNTIADTISRYPAKITTAPSLSTELRSYHTMKDEIYIVSRDIE
jgi:hypothetical protein